MNNKQHGPLIVEGKLADSERMNRKATSCEARLAKI